MKYELFYILQNFSRDFPDQLEHSTMESIYAYCLRKTEEDGSIAFPAKNRTQSP